MENFEFEELPFDPENPGVGRMWLNTTEKRLKFVTELDELNRSIIRSVATAQDVEALNTLLSAHAGSHAPGGSDAIPTGSAVGLTSASINKEGTASTLARADHEHQITGFQHESAELTQIAALQDTGLLKRGSDGTWILTLLSAGDIPDLDFSKITTGKPTTVEGYGITNAVSSAEMAVVEQTFEDGAANNGFVSQTDTDIGFDNATRVFTIAPKNTDYRYYVRGKRFVRSAALTVTIGNQDGLWFVYFDVTGSIQASKTPWDLFLTAPIAIVYWNSSLSQAQFVGEERHMCTMDPATHEYMHHTEGTRYRGGLVIGDYVLGGDGSSNAHAQLSISDGEIQDEDIIISIKHAAVPAGIFEQVLTAPAKLPVMYRVGSSWVRDISSTYPVKTVTQRIAYNAQNAGVWSAVQADEGAYVAMYIVATNAMSEPVVALMGQRQDTVLDEAKQFNDFAKLSWGEMPFPEFKALYRVVFQTNSAYTSDIKARIVEIADLRNVVTQTISAIPTANHDALTGLYADDHKQYVHNSLPRQITAQHTFAPASAQAPFALGANAVGQLVAGLNADLLDGLSADAFQLASVQLTNLASLTGVGIPKRLANGSWSLGNLVASDIPSLDWSKITAGKPTTLAGYGITDATPTNVARIHSGNVPVMSGTSTILMGSSAPTAAQGTLLFSKAVVPTDNLSRFLIQFSGSVDASVNNNNNNSRTATVLVSLFRSINGGAYTYITYAAASIALADNPNALVLSVEDSPATNLPVTYMARIGISGTVSWYLGRTVSFVMGATNPSGWSIAELRPN